MTVDFLKDPTAVLVLSITVVMFLEGFLTQRKQEVFTRRWGSNLMMGIINVALGPAVFGAIFSIYVSIGMIESPGLLGLAQFGFTKSLFLTLVSLELVNYWWHRLSHALPLLWSMHKVHHSDPEVDVTTTLRHHPLESALSTFVTLPVVLLLGPEPEVMFAAGAIAVLLDAISHGNVKLGVLDRPISLLVVTPGFHCVHHSADPAYSDSNFSNNLPIFDYIFGTSRRWTREELRTRKLGLLEYSSQQSQRIDKLLIQPFKKPQIAMK